MTTPMFAELDAGTAMPETARCANCVSWAPDPEPLENCSGNDQLACQACGWHEGMLPDLIITRASLSHRYIHTVLVAATPDSSETLFVEMSWPDPEGYSFAEAETATQARLIARVVAAGYRVISDPGDEQPRILAAPKPRCWVTATPPGPGLLQTRGWFDASESTWAERPDRLIVDLPDGFYLVSPDVYFWGPRPTLEDLDQQVTTGDSPGGPTLGVDVDDWYLEISAGSVVNAWHPLHTHPVSKGDITP